MSHANFSAFLDSWSIELSAQSNRVRHLIGEIHWLSDGNHKESVIRAFLRRYLPAAITVGSGFGMNIGEERAATRQVDVLVCDFRDQTPFLVEGELIIAPVASVVAHLEIKSKLSSSVLKDALDNVLENEVIVAGPDHSPWRGIVFFSADDFDEIRFKGWMESILSSVGVRILDQQITPLCIIGVGKFIAFIDEIDANGARLRVLATGDKSLAFGMLDLLSSVRSRFGGRHTDQIDMIAQSAISTEPGVHKLEFQRS